MAVRELARSLGGGALSTGMARLNARHPWSHNDHVHRWIVANLPPRRRVALDVETALRDVRDVRDLLAPSGRFLVDHLWDVASTDRNDQRRSAG